VKNPIPDASTARIWSLLSDASSSAVIKSLARISVTAFPPAAYAAYRPPGRVLLLRRKLSDPGNAPTWK
jgi:hypothetical protein